MLTYILLLGLGWLAEIAWLSLDLELTLRVLASGALLWHPIHEQRLGFRWRFNLAATPQYRKPIDCRDLVRNAPPRGWPDRWPLSRRMNRLQAAGLMTVFPALALVGPWWAVLGMAAFYFGDAVWTHSHQVIPGKWSAALGTAALFSLLLVVLTTDLEPRLWQILGAIVAGIALLAIPWWRAYQRVRS